MVSSVGVCHPGSFCQRKTYRERERGRGEAVTLLGVEHIGSGVRAFEDRLVEPNRQQNHCVVSLSKTLYPLLSTNYWVQPRKTHTDMTEKLLA